jgi:hypothetical protein
MRQLGLRFLTLGKKSTSHGVSLTRNRRSRLSVECLEQRDLLAVGTLTGVAYEIDAVTGTDFGGLPDMQSVESTGTLTTASGSLPIQYNEQFPPGYATMNGSVNFTFPQTVTLGQTASISASSQATWNNSGLGFGRPTSIEIDDGIGPYGLDDKGYFTNGTTSAQVNWSDSVAVPTGSGSVTLPTVTVTVDGKEDKIITLTASYQTTQAPTVTGVSPQTGEPSGGTTVTVSGSGFTNASAVSFGGIAATAFTVDSGTQITATAPAGTGTVDVTVTTPLGTSATSGADQFTYGRTTPTTLTWTGGGDNESWSDPENWDKDESPIDGDSLVFPANNSATTQNDRTDLALASITINGDYTLAGNTIGVGSGITVTAGTSVLAMPTVLALGGTELDVNGGSFEVASALSGPGSIQVTGPTAKLELHGNVTTTGMITLQGIQTSTDEIENGDDTLQVDGPNSMGTGPLVLNGGTFSYTGNGTLVLPQTTLNNNVTIQTAGEIQFNSDVIASSGNVDVTLSGGGSLDLSLVPQLGTGTLIMTGIGRVNLGGNSFVLHDPTDSGSGTTASINPDATRFDVHALEMIDAEGALQIVITGLDNELWQGSLQSADGLPAGWSDWEDLFASLKAFDVVRDPTGHVQIYGIGAATGDLYEWNDGNTFSKFLPSVINHWTTVDNEHQYLEVSAAVDPQAGVMEAYAVTNEGVLYALPTGTSKRARNRLVEEGRGYDQVELEPGLADQSLVVFAHDHEPVPDSSGWVSKNLPANAKAFKKEGWTASRRWLDGGMAIPLAQMPVARKTDRFKIRLVGEADVSKKFPTGYGASGWEFEIAPRNAAFGAPTTYLFLGAGYSIGIPQIPGGVTSGSTNWINFETHTEQTVNEFGGEGAISVNPSVQILHHTILSSGMRIGFIHLISNGTSVSVKADFDSPEGVGFTAYAFYAGLWFRGGALVV